MLLDLPFDVLVAIVEKVTDQEDLKHLCEVSKSLQDLTTPILYRSITIRAENDGFMQSIDVHPFLLTRYTSRNLLHFVKAIQIRPRNWTRTRCFHNCVDAIPGDEDDKGHPAMTELVEDLLPLLEGISDDKLQEFVWKLGSCIPQKILGDSGYLTDKQSSIESIRLITSGHCYGQCPLDLSAFKGLKKLSWKNVKSESDFEALAIALNQNAFHLRELELDLIQWRLHLSHLDNDDGFLFARDILQLPPDGPRQVFSALRVLSLSAVSFESTEESIVSAFDFSSLHSLKLRFCPGWFALLKQITKSNQTINLKSFEIQYDTWDRSCGGTDVVTSFLQTFVGLEELFVSTEFLEPPLDESPLDLWRSLLQHESTLKRFAHHQRSENTDCESPTYKQEHDVPDLCLLPQNMTKLAEDTSKNPFSDLDLECIGLCCFPRHLKSILLPLARKRTLQVLHIRQSKIDLEHFASWGVRRLGDISLSDSESEDNSSRLELAPTGQSDKSGRVNGSTSDNNELSVLTKQLHDFAQWAFGPSGFPSLRVLAFGDFSYQSRFSENNVHLCRDQVLARIGEQTVKSQSFRFLADDDESLWDLLDKYSNVLEACPTDRFGK